MNEHSDDADFNSLPDAEDAFDSLPDSDSAVPLDTFDQLSNEANSGKVYPPIPDAPAVGSSKSIVFPPEPDRPKRPGRPWFKIVAGVLFVALVGAGGVKFGPRLFNGNSTKTVVVIPPDQQEPPGGGNTTVPGQEADPPGAGSPGGAYTPAQPETPNTPAQSAFHSIEQLKKDLESADVTIKRKARKEILAASVEPNSNDVTVLMELRKALKQRLIDKSSELSPEQKREDNFTINTLDLKLKDLVESDEPDQPTEMTGVQLTPPSVDVDGAAIESPFAATLPIHYAFIVAAVFGAVDPTDEDLIGNIKMKLKDPKLPKDEEYECNFALAVLYLKSSNMKQALNYLGKAETYAKKSTTDPVYLMQVETLRRQIVDDGLRTIRKETSNAIATLKTETKQELTNELATLKTATKQELTNELATLKTATKQELTNGLATLKTATKQELTDGLALFDDAVRQSIRSWLEPANLPDRLSKCKPSDENAKVDLVKAAKNVESKRNPNYLKEDLLKLRGKDLWAVYEGLREIEINLVAWETRQALDAVLDSPDAKKKIAALVLEGIRLQKDNADGLLADIKKLDKVDIEQLTQDIQKLKITPTPNSNPNPNSGGSGGISAAALELRAKKAEELARQLVRVLAERLADEEKTRATNDTELSKGLKTLGTKQDQLVETSNQFSRALEDATTALAAVRGDLKTVRTELEAKIEQPRPIPKTQLEELQRGLAGKVEKSVADELARRGVLPVELPICEIPKGSASEANRKTASYFFSQGCEHFSLTSKEQMSAATRYFSDATTHNPHDPVYRYFLGCSLYFEGRLVEGQNQVRCAAEIEKGLHLEHAVPRRLERIQFGVRQWLERTRQSVLLGL